jgi:hypothetical protein
VAGAKSRALESLELHGGFILKEAPGKEKSDILYTRFSAHGSLWQRLLSFAPYQF